MKISNKQLQEMQKIDTDRQANQNTLAAAYNVSNEVESSLIARHRALWAELAEIHSLDINNKKYGIQTVDGTPHIVELAVEQDA